MLCATPSSSRADTSSAEQLTSFFRNNLHARWVSCGTRHWHFKAPSTSLWPELTHGSVSSVKGRVTLITPASDFNHPGWHLDAESGPGSGIERCSQRHCTAPECYRDTERFLFTDRLHDLDRKPGPAHSQAVSEEKPCPAHPETRLPTERAGSGKTSSEEGRQNTKRASTETLPTF